MDILDLKKIKYFVKDYMKIKDSDLKKASKVIICGTSLFDNEFIKNTQKFKWIKSFDKPILGICGGMQIIGLVFGGRIQKGSEIGFYTEFFGKNSVSLTSDDKQEVRHNEDFNFEFLGMLGNCDVYHLHNNFIDFSEIGFRVYCSNGIISQAVKHREKNILGVLFHPEVRNKDLIIKFVDIL